MITFSSKEIHPLSKAGHPTSSDIHIVPFPNSHNKIDLENLVRILNDCPIPSGMWFNMLNFLLGDLDGISIVI